MNSTALSVLTTRLFVCFESCKLLCYVTDSSQFTIEGGNTKSLWDEVTVDWLTKVKGIIERSVDNPKSLAKLMALLDCWRRATAGYLEFRARGVGGNQHRELPGWLNEESAEGIRRVERETAGRRQRANLDAGGKAGISVVLGELWFCDVAESWVSDLFTVGSGGAGDGESENHGMVAIKEVLNEEIPEVGRQVSLGKPIRGFGGFIKPGVAVIESAYRDASGRAFVNLARNGTKILEGQRWPIV